ncbi:MAG: hypothetical protein WCO58_01850 [bacterium]
MQLILGLDIVGVIIDRCRTEAMRTLWQDSENYQDTPEVPGAIGSIHELWASPLSPFQENIHLISRVKTPEGEGKTIQWLKENRFFQRTGVPQENVIFCNERFQKVEIAQSRGITHFVDDRLEVLGLMGGAISYLYLLNKNPTDNTVIDESVITDISKDWKNLLPKLLSQTAD